MNETSQQMTYEEREKLKEFGHHHEDPRLLGRVVVMIAHWMRQEQRVPFSDYASDWMVANGPLENAPFLRMFPHSGTRHIQDRCSDWNGAKL